MTLRHPRRVAACIPVLRSLGLVAGMAYGAVMLAACSEKSQACYPRDIAYCACPTSVTGARQCAADGSGYGECDCTGALLKPRETRDAGVTYLGPCETSADCESGQCYPFNAKGPRCTLSCQTTTDCPPPSPGCNNQGVCKAL